jgi:hypothetical protein
VPSGKAATLLSLRVAAKEEGFDCDRMAHLPWDTLAGGCSPVNESAAYPPVLVVLANYSYPGNPLTCSLWCAGQSPKPPEDFVLHSLRDTLG